MTSRGIHGQNIFSEEGDYLMYLELLGKYKSQHGFKLFAFALMPGHLHLLVETNPETTLSDIMHNVTSSYTKYFNKKYSRQGHLFRGRFRATIIEKEANLLKVIRHIHLGPVRLNLCEDFQTYPYSSYLYYGYYSGGARPAGAASLDLKSEVEEVSGFLGGITFQVFMQEATREAGEVLHQELHRNIYLGSEEFGRRVQQKIAEVASDMRVSDEEGPRGVGVARFVVPAVSGLLLTAVAGSLLLHTQRLNKKAPVAVNEDTEKIGAPDELEEDVAFEVVGLDGSIWQVRFVAGTPFQTVDTLSFEKGKMSSENLHLNDYPASNYSTSKEGGRLVWETMQTSPSGTASWRGEVEAGQMKGILSLRQNSKEPQDFSFVSMKYRMQKANKVTSHQVTTSQGRK